MDILFAAGKVSKYRVISGPYFPAFRLNTERYFVFLRIQSECGEIRTINYSVFGHFSRSDTFSVRVKPIQNVIIKNNPWLEILLHLKQYCFLIFVIQDLAILENCTRM